MFWLIPVIFVLLAAVIWLTLSPTSQIFGAFPYHGPTDQKSVALTFDDGPNQPYTGQLLDLLRKEQVSATFFVVGANLKTQSEVVRRAEGEGHTIGNHALSHQFRSYFKHPSFKAEMTQNQSLISQAIGKTPALFRPPWLFRTPLILSSAKSLRLAPISGTFTNNWEIFQPSAQKIAQSAYRRTKPGSILIFHDGYNAKSAARDQTIAAVGLLITKLKADGYQFKTVDQLLGIPAYRD